MEDTVKPCPFCGHSETEMHVYEDAGSQVHAARICINCDARGPERVHSDRNKAEQYAGLAWEGRTP